MDRVVAYIVIFGVPIGMAYIALIMWQMIFQHRKLYAMEIERLQQEERGE